MAKPTLQSLLLLLLLLSLSLSVANVAAGGRKHRKKKGCYNPNPMPICKSDRFDVVFSHYDDDKCKVYKCQCRIPDTKTCPQGRPQIKSDQHGCQYYECISCPINQVVCQGSQVSRYVGDDANGCQQFRCECQPNPVRPTCGANEELQSVTDSSGCPSYSCRQVRAQCPEKPQCSNNQELVSAGVIGDCEVFRCECLTPTKPSCGIGSQPRLQDDGLGCQEYRCVENRSPCPPEPNCPSSHQVVSQDGVDSNNCVKYVCKCIPLSPITCPDGYRMELDTDEACGCQFYRCEPNCAPKPICQSAYQHAVVTATRSNGCPSYNCECKEPEVISCADPDAALRLTKATDGSNCDVYVCQSGNNRNCPVPSCANPVATGAVDANGCPIYTCNGVIDTGNRNNNCQMIQCPVGQQAVQVGFSSPTCPFYACESTRCLTRSQSCGATQVPIVTTDINGCLNVICNDNRNGMCSHSSPSCVNGEQLTSVGPDSYGCEEFVCVRPGCPQPPTCTIGERLVRSDTTNGLCPIYFCQQDTRSSRSGGVNCPVPQCGLGGTLTLTGYSNNCPVYTCSSSSNRNGGLNSNCIVPTCPPQQTPIPTGGTDGFGCAQYICQALGNTVYNGGTRSIGNNYACPQPTFCPDGSTPPIISTSGVCPVYGNCFTNTNNFINGGNRAIGGIINNFAQTTSSCPSQPTCQYHEFRVRSQQQVGNQICDVDSCVKLGDYNGQPSKCLDNPSYCDANQTVETYVEYKGGNRRGYNKGRYGRKADKKCQRVECKGSSVSHY